MFVVFDLDGTLALVDHRRHHVTGPRGTRDYAAFYAAYVDDSVNEPVLQSLRAHAAAGHRVEIWSARSDEVRVQTEDWLAEACRLPACWLTHMRRAGDATPDVVLKRQWLHEVRLGGGAPDLVYDDRSDVVRMWREEGIACFQVAPFEVEAPRPELFCEGEFRLHSGGQSSWKIECDALSSAEVALLARLVAERAGPFGPVVGVPRGGVRLAHALRRYAAPGCATVLLVDDVATTGRSLVEADARLRAEGVSEVRSFVLFARGDVPPWVGRLFQVTPNG